MKRQETGTQLPTQANAETRESSGRRGSLRSTALTLRRAKGLSYGTCGYEPQ